MVEYFRNLPRLYCVPIRDRLLCSEGISLERYGRHKNNEISGNSINLERSFEPLHKEDGEISQIVGNEKTEFVFITSGRYLARYALSDVLSDANTVSSGNCIPDLYNMGKRIAHSYLFEDETILVVFADSSVQLLSIREPETVLKLLSAPKVMEIMGAVCDGENWASCRLLVFTYLGSMVQIRPGLGNQPLTVFDGSPGMVFGALLSGNHCFSVHDDRSLRVWDLQSTGDACSIAAEFAHKARPFSICFGGGDSIYTGSNDRTIARWKWDEETRQLTLAGEVVLSVGTMRKICVFESLLIVCSDAGFLVSVPLSAFDFPENEVVPTPDEVFSVRSCYSTNTDEFVIDHKGRLISLSGGPDSNLSRPARYFAFPCGFEPSTSDVAVPWSDRIIVDLKGAESREYNSEERTVFVSVVRCGERVIAARSDDIAISLCSTSEGFVECCRFSLRTTRLNIAKKNPFIINTTVCLRTRNRTHYIFGCASGHLLASSFDSESDWRSNGAFECVVLTEASRHFGGDTVQDLWVEQGHLYALGKNGYMTVWEVDESKDDVSLYLIQKVSLGMDWPCRFIETRINYGLERFVVGFHSTTCVLYSFDRHLIVWRAECGGGNRHWQFAIGSDRVVRLRYIKDETLCMASSRLALPDVLDQPLHIGKVVFIHCLNFEDFVYIFSAGMDNRLVLSRLLKNGGAETLVERVEPEGFISGCLQQTSPGRAVLVCGLAKGRILAIDVDLSKKNAIGGFLPLTLRPRLSMLAAEIGVSGRLQVGTEDDSRNLSDDVLFAVADDASDSAVAIRLEDCRTQSAGTKIFSGDRAGFSKVSIANKTVLVGASTNGSLYASRREENANIELSKCGLSALSLLQLSPDESIAALGDESGAVHLVRITSHDNIRLLPIAKRNYVHTSTVTAVRLTPIGDRFRVISTSLDCQIAVSELRDEELRLVGRSSTRVQDPSGLCLLRADPTSTRLIVFGSGIESTAVRNFE